VGVAAAARVAFGRNQHMLAQSRQQMTTNRTAIRRRLAIGRTAHRPPWGGWKTSHRSIVAPLAATVAATVAVGVGVVLAKAGRAHHAERVRRRDRRFALRRREPLSDGLARVALGQIDLVLEVADGPKARTGGIDEKSLHDMRKALKRLRALLRLLEKRLGPAAFEREDAALHGAAARLSEARDAEVLLATLDGLIKRNPSKLAGRRGVLRLRRQLLAAQSRTRVDELTRAHVLIELREMRGRVALWRLPQRGGIELIEPGLKRCYRDGRRRYRRVARGKGEQVRAMHEWRKRVKELRYAAELLGRRGLAGRADELGELLGEDHDLALLAERIRARPKRYAAERARVPRKTRKLLLKLIGRRRRELRRRALREGKRLYRHAPKPFMARVRAADGRRDRVS